MEFDPASYAASLTGQGTPAPVVAGFDPASYAASLAAGPDVTSPGGDFVTDEGDESEKPGLAEAVARGAGQGLTLGFKDELTAGLESLLTTKTYRDSLAESRANDEAARKAHPWGFGIGEAVGGLATPGIGEATALVKGTSLAAHAARGAIVGGVAGLGNSTADLTSGDVGGAVRDTAAGALMGAGIGAVVGKGTEMLTRGAEGRSDSRLVQEVTGGRATTAAKKIYRDDSVMVDAARKFGLDEFHGDREAMAEAAEGAKKEVGAKIGDAFAQADDVFLGVKNKDLVSEIRGTAQKYDTPAQAPVRKQIKALADETEAQWGDGRVPLSAVDKLKSVLKTAGYGGSAEFSPAVAKQLQRDLSSSVENVLDRRLAEISEFADHLNAAPTAGRSAPLAESMSAADTLKNLKSLRRDYQGLSRITEMNEELSGVPPQNRAAGGLRNIANGAVDMGILFHNPLAYVAKKGGEKLAHTAGRGADEILAKIGRAARAGDSTSRLIQQAIEAGIPRSAIATAVAAK